MAGWYSMTWIYYRLFNQLPTEHLGFQFEAIVNKAAVNICEQVLHDCKVLFLGVNAKECSC